MKYIVTAILLFLLIYIPTFSQVSIDTSPIPIHKINLNISGKPINPGIRGMALADSTLENASQLHGIPDTLKVAKGSSIRGVAGGLYADLYDWRTRVSNFHSWYSDTTQPRPTTLEFLRWARDYNATLFITVNTRGLVHYDKDIAGKVKYYTTSIDTLAQLAKDWVRYTNHIVPSYREGDKINNPDDNRILNSLLWHSSFAGDTFHTLLSKNESPVPKIKYWEIGNEPTVSVGGGIGVTNGTRLSPQEYHDRYKAITLAMKKEDPSIKVGLCLVNGSGKNADYILSVLSDPAVPVDFISYHPYQKLGNQTTTQDIEHYLGTIFDNQQKRWNDIQNAIIKSGRNPDRIERVASEVNVSDWRFNETIKEGEMAHALGSVETIFAFAQLSLTAAHYWIWPADAGDGTPYPVYKSFERLRDYLGDRLIDSYNLDNKAKIYTTRNTKTGQIALWCLNFQNDKSQTLKLSLQGLHHISTLRQLTLQNVHGTTSFTSANFSRPPSGVPLNDVDWVETDISNPKADNITIILKPSTISVVLLN